MLELEVLIGKLLTVDGLASGTLQSGELDDLGRKSRGLTYVTTGEVTTLEHEVGDDSVERGAGIAKALLASAEGTEVFSGLGDDIVEQVEVDAASLGYMETRVSTCL